MAAMREMTLGHARKLVEAEKLDPVQISGSTAGPMIRF